MNYWGRIFFIYDGDRLTGIIGQTLENHTSNTRAILEDFHPTYIRQETRERLMIAAELHDLGKKDTFRIAYDQDVRTGIKPKTAKLPKTENKLVYSFAGHRFRVPEDDPYIAGLIRSHHEFSVEQINREKARLLSEKDKEYFADDLYLLCMADQIEAELAVKTVEGKEDCPRTFMEFTTVRSAIRPDTFTVVPWPFATSGLLLTFNLRELCIEGREKCDAIDIEKALKAENDFQDEAITITLMERLDGN